MKPFETGGDSYSARLLDNLSEEGDGVQYSILLSWWRHDGGGLAVRLWEVVGSAELRAHTRVTDEIIQNSDCGQT